MSHAGLEANTLLVLSSSPYFCPVGELLAEPWMQHDQWDSRRDVATIYVPDIAGFLQPGCLQVRPACPCAGDGMFILCTRHTCAVTQRAQGSLFCS